MDSAYSDGSSLWDLAHPTSLPLVSEDDFMAMLQKPFPLSVAPLDQSVRSLAAGGISDAVNPQNISRHSLSSVTPPSEDSSPSPPHNNGSNHDSNAEDGGGGGSGTIPTALAMEPALKRKASGVGIQEGGPSQKSQHTLSNDKKGATQRRKLTGNVAKDEGRLMKRKEQNRAAQRAFRERKEKHVKDLEDKVAELEAQNDAAQHENENLRDLLSRLQSENVMLKQAGFTFSMPAKTQADSATSIPSHFSPENSLFNSSPSQSSVILPTSSHASPKPTNLVDWTSLTSFDPNMLNLLDESPQPTATTSAMSLDLFGANTGLASNSPFTTIASNPMFMSFASSFDSASPPTGDTSGIAHGNGNRSSTRPFSFDLNSMSSWPTPTPPTQDTTSLDDLFAGYLHPNQTPDFTSQFTASTPSISPVSHQTAINGASFANANNDINTFLQKSSSPTHLSSMSSPSSQSTASSEQSLNTPKDSHSVPIPGVPETDHRMDIIKTGNEGSLTSNTTMVHDKSCPKTKSELVQRIAEAGSSPFAPPALEKSTEGSLGMMIPCAGSNFPRTPKSDKNVEMLSALRSITSNPVFKDAKIDINDLCAEFTSKAKCDGTKVVLEREEMHNIIESLTTKKQ